MKTKHVLIAAGSLVGLGLLAYAYHHHQSDKKEGDKKPKPEDESLPEPELEVVDMEDGYATPTPSSPGSQFPPQAPQQTPPPVADEFPLRLGSKGPRVERLQIWLMRNYGGTRPITGRLDPGTVNRMIKYLHTDNLDEVTYRSLGMGLHVQDQPKR